MFRQAEAPSQFDDADLSCLTRELEMRLMKQLASWPALITSAAKAHEPHRIAFYLMELAANFHSLWNGGRDDPTLKFIQADDEAVTKARLYLVSVSHS